MRARCGVVNVEGRAKVGPSPGKRQRVRRRPGARRNVTVAWPRGLFAGGAGFGGLLARARPRRTRRRVVRERRAHRERPVGEPRRGLSNWRRTRATRCRAAPAITGSCVAFASSITNRAVRVVPERPRRNGAIAEAPPANLLQEPAVLAVSKPRAHDQRHLARPQSRIGLRRATRTGRRAPFRPGRRAREGSADRPTCPARARTPRRRTRPRRGSPLFQPKARRVESASRTPSRHHACSARPFARLEGRPASRPAR